MKFCRALYGALNIENSNIFLCCAAKRDMPTIPWCIEEGIPLERVQRVRDALIKALNEDMDQPIDDYMTYGSPGGSLGHPCKGCRYIEEVDDDFSIPSTSMLTDFLNIGAFTYCNADCIYCNAQFSHPQQKTIARRNPHLNGREVEKAIYKAVTQLFNADAISPTCRFIFASGEPSISKMSMNLLSYIVKQGYKSLINTNGICFAPEIANALMAGRAEVQISLDSGDRSSFKKIKGVDKFQAVSDNIDRYQTAVKKESCLWIKYILFSKNNSEEITQHFIDFCVRHQTRNVVLTTNTFEGELGIDRKDSGIEYQTLKAFGRLAAELQFLGIDVFQEFHFLTQKEQNKVELEYARYISETLGHQHYHIETYKQVISNGIEFVRLSTDSPRMRDYMIAFLRDVAKDSKEIGLFGAGSHAKWMTSIMKELGIQPTVSFDNNPPKKSDFIFPVVKPDEIVNYPVDTVVVASNAFHLPIYAQLSNMPEFEKVRIVDPYLNILPVSLRQAQYTA